MADFKITTLEQLKVALQAAKTYIDGQIDGLGSLAGKSEVTYDDLAAALKTLIDGKADGSVVTTLVGEDTGKSVRAISAEEVAKTVAGADASYDTLKEIADWILNDTTGAAKMANDITRLDAILDGIEEGANKTVIYDGLDSTDATQALSAAQGKVLDDKIKAINTNMENLGAGDMLKSVYDTDGNGKVDGADNADKLGGVAAADYAQKTDLHTHANKDFLDTLSAATTDEVTAMCAEVFGA